LETAQERERDQEPLTEVVYSRLTPFLVILGNPYICKLC